MKVTIPEISWHNRDPVFSADFCYCNGAEWRMATAGADSHVMMWKVLPHIEDKDAEITFLSKLSRHTNTVNCVRFSPDGLTLASAGDDGALFLWTEREKKDDDASEGVFGSSTNEDAEPNKEHWVAYKMLRGHIEDVMDLSWSPEGNHIISGSIDNSAIVWDVKSGTKLHLLKDHSHYVQGVAWDPLGTYLCSLSSDRSMRIYEAARGNLLFNVTKFSSDSTECRMDCDGVKEQAKSNRMFVEEGATKYFRRLSFSPDGALLVAPGGQYDTSEDLLNATIMFSRGNFKKPISYYPGPKKPVCAVRYSPVLYELKPDTKSRIRLPYRMVFAVATLSEVFLYDTVQSEPFCQVTDIHYACITDLAWSSNGRVLTITSYDGFCTILSFEDSELGTLYTAQVEEINAPRLQTLSTGKSPKQKKKKKSPKTSPKVENGGSPAASKNNDNENMDVPAAHQPAEFCVTPKRVKLVACENTPMDTSESPKIEKSAVSDPLKEAVCVTPKRVKLISCSNTSLHNKLITPTKESEKSLKRITPTKVDERNNCPIVNVIDLSEDSNDCSKTTEVLKPSRRIAPTKVD